MTIVKICGLRTIEHALAAVEAGADLLGFIFAPARRQVSRAEVAAIGAAVRAAPGGSRVGLVGVFVDEPAGHMLDIAGACGLDALQLSGDEAAAIVGELCAEGADRAIIKTLRLAGADTEQGWLAAGPPGRLHVDAHVPGAYGGGGAARGRGPAAGAAPRGAAVPCPGR